MDTSTCAQDLRQDFTPHFTKLELHVGNAHAHSFLLSQTDARPENLSRAVLGTEAAFIQPRGVASTQCRPRLPFVTENVGLVSASAESLRNGVLERPLHGTSANTAGIHAVPGFVLWDPQDAEVPEAP